MAKHKTKPQNVLVRDAERSGADKQKMKRYGNLFEKVCGPQNIAAAHRNARKGKRSYREVKMVDSDPQRFFAEIRRLLESGAYKTSPYEMMIKNEYGKPRVIHKLPYFPDRIVHHAIIQVVGPIWDRTLIRDTYACIRGRGIHDGGRRLKKALKDREGTRYCLKMDVKKFYPSMSHEVLKAIVRRKIKDRRLLDLLDEIIDSLQGDAGVPIGNYVSQFFGNLYLSGYDHWTKEVQRCRYYFRYCDDVVILAADKARLHRLCEMTRRYWAGELIVKLKNNIAESKYSKNKSGKYLTLQFIDEAGERHVLFTGSDVLIEQLLKYEDEIPFVATIKRVDRYYILT